MNRKIRFRLLAGATVLLALGAAWQQFGSASADDHHAAKAACRL
jgi:hypothetical protein